MSSIAGRVAAGSALSTSWGHALRLRAELINAVRQSSRDIRDEWRRFYKEREQEEEKDWDDEF